MPEQKVDIFGRPKNLRTILLAYPKATRRTRKYRPPVHRPGWVDSGVPRSAIEGEPPDNWRLGELAKSVPRKKTEKFVPVPENLLSGISPSTLAGEGTSRSHDLSRPNLRYLKLNKTYFSFLGPRFIKNMDKMIDQSWNSIYNYYRRTLLEVNKRKRRRLGKVGTTKKVPKGKGGKPMSPKELKAAKEKRFAEWAALRAQPKKVFKPKPPRKRKIANLVAMAERINQISEPRVVTKKYVRPSIDPTYVDPMRVSLAARTYKASEPILKLAACPAHRLIKEPVIIPGSVKRGALKGPVPPKFAELAVPKKKAAEKDNDLKENPFMISPNALKYKPTPRVLELSKPIER